MGTRFEHVRGLQYIGVYSLLIWFYIYIRYAVRESSAKIKVYKNFKEITGLFSRIGYTAEGIFGGSLLGVRSNTFINFYDWESGNIVRRIDVTPKQVSIIIAS
jgi:coatomer subunit beta'